MIKNKLLIFTIILLGIFLVGCTSIDTAPIQTNTVEIIGFEFNPEIITVSKGTTVTWTNRDIAVHTVTGTGFDSGNLQQGETFSYTFNEAGLFNYICTIHPYMKGKVIVE